MNYSRKNHELFMIISQGKASLGEGNSSLFKWRATPFSNYEIAKIDWKNLNLPLQCFLRCAMWPMGLLFDFYFRTTGLMSTKICASFMVSIFFKGIHFWFFFSMRARTLFKGLEIIIQWDELRPKFCNFNDPKNDIVRM